LYADSASLTRLWKTLVEGGLANVGLRFTHMIANKGTQNACSDLKVCDASLRARWFKTFAITRGSSYW